MVSWLLARKIVSLFVMILLGTFLSKKHLITAEESTILSKLTLYAIMPCMILSAFQVEYSAKVLEGLLLAFLAAILLHVLLIGATALLKRLFSLDGVESTSLIYSNAGNLILPIVVSVLGSEWGIYSSAFLSVQLVLIWSHGRMTLCSQKGVDLKKIVSNVNMVAVLIGLFFFLVRIRFPLVVEDAVSSIGSMIGPMSMLIIGILMGEMDFRKILCYPRLWMIVFFRLVVLPLLSLLFLKFSGLAQMVPQGETILLVSLLATSTPSASTITQMAQVYGQDADYASAINVVTTLFCILTMPLIVFLYQA